MRYWFYIAAEVKFDMEHATKLTEGYLWLKRVSGWNFSDPEIIIPSSSFDSEKKMNYRLR